MIIDVCPECKELHPLVRHHDDYHKPTRLLCHTCHRKWHRLNGHGKNWVSNDRQLVAVNSILHQRIKYFAACNHLPLQDVADHLLAYGLKHVSKVAMQTGTPL